MSEQKNVNNVGNEICFVGSIFKNPDLLVSYKELIRSKYDFSDEVTRFLYDSAEVYYLTYSESIDETKMNMFMSQDSSRLEQYRNFKGWKTIQSYMKIADDSDVENYYRKLKVFSLLREYQRNGFPVDRIMNSNKFDTFTASDIYRIIRTKADSINTVISAGEEAVELTEGNTDTLSGYLRKPRFGLAYPWSMYNEYYLGMRESKVVFEGFLSNEGKTRKLMKLAAWVALVKNEKFLLMSNEMDEPDLRSCLITTILNNNEFKKLHGVDICKCEKEITLGVYHDDKGEIIRRYINETTGEYTEEEEEYIQRIEETSSEYREVKKVTDWIDSNDQGNLLFKDVGDDYSIKRIEFELRKYKVIKGVKYYGYDTLKCFSEENWGQLKQDATKLKEISKELHMFGFAVFQLTDETVFTDIFQLSSNNISSSKGIKHVVDHLGLGKKIGKDEYHKYQYYEFVSNGDWGEQLASDLNPTKQYFAIKIDKNRAGNKDKIMLFEIDLDYNTWYNIGYLIKRPKEKKED